MKKIVFTLLIIATCTMQSIATVVPTVQKISLDKSWLFVKGDLAGVWEAVRPHLADNLPLWTQVSLPHCVNALDAVDPDLNYYQGPMWYRKQLDLHNPYTNGRTLLEFEGAGQKTEVYIYDQKVGSHVGGYDGWSVDITDAVVKFLESSDAKRFNGKIPLTIRCDNSRDFEMIPSNISDFNLYGGLYRHVNLIYVPSISFKHIQLDAAVDQKGQQGTLRISTTLYNPTADQSGLKLNVTITNPSGKVIVDETGSIKTSNNNQLVLEKMFKKPILWDVDSPLLYKVSLKLTSDRGAVEAKDCFGFRNYVFKDHGPFFLNGRRLLIRGTQRHEDGAGVAAAENDSTVIREMKMIKAMGANFIRLGHYQQSDLVLHMCDSLGLMVWEEVPWCRGGLGNVSYQTQAKRMLTNMITQHRNHPAVVLWGMGNENDWPGDFTTFDKDSIRNFMKEMVDLSHQLDPSRLTSIRRCSFCSDIVDVYSPSIWPGWYKGRYTDYKNVTKWESSRVKHFLHVEWGGDSQAGRFSEDPYTDIDQPDYATSSDATVDNSSPAPYTGNKNVAKKGDWSESYICDLFDWTLKEQETMPNLTGSVEWCFKDFSTPLRPQNPVPYMNQKGVVTRDLSPKESYYVFQSYWAKQSMIHIFGHTWETRWGNANEPKMLKVYSNCDEVELFLNGASLGKHKRNVADFPATGFHWTTVLKEGENHVKAVGYKKIGKSVKTFEDRMKFDYQTTKWGVEARIQAKVIEQGNGYMWVEAYITDANEILCLNSKRVIQFGYTGDGKMNCDMGTPTSSRTVEAVNGRARIKIEIPKGGKGVVSVRSKGLSTTLVQL